MKKEMDKLKNKLGMNRKIFYFLIILFIIGIAFGSALIVIMNKPDQTLVTNYLNDFFSHVKGNGLNYSSALFQSIVSNLLFVVGIWLLGISVVGLPIMLFMYFSKAFVLGFTIASMIQNFSWKGILYALFYTFPHQILGMIIYTFLLMYAMSLSISLIKAFTKKKTIDFRKIMNRYLFVLAISIIGSVAVSLLEVFLMPFLIRLVI